MNKSKPIAGASTDPKLTAKWYPWIIGLEPVGPQALKNNETAPLIIRIKFSLLWSRITKIFAKNKFTKLTMK